MASRLAKKKKQQQVHGSRRTAIWRFLSTRHPSPRGNEEFLDDSDEPESSIMAVAHQDDINISKSSMLTNDNDEVASVCSRYSDAHSTWEHPSTSTREDAISRTFSELLRADAQRGSSEHDSTPVFCAGANTGRSGSHGPSEEFRAEVINPESVSDHLNAYLADWSYVSRPDQPVDGAAASCNAPSSSTHNSQGQSMLEADRPPPTQGKGKGVVDRESDWSRSANPWARLDLVDPTPKTRDSLREEIAALQAELRKLETEISTNMDQSQCTDSNPVSPSRPSVTGRPSSRARRMRSKKRQDVAVFETITLRDLVLKRVFAPHVLVDGIIHEENTPISLDTPLTPEQIKQFTCVLNDVITSGQHLKQPIALCAVCHLPKFKGIKGSHQSSYVSEVLAQLPIVPPSAFADFDQIWGTSRCCRKFVCKTCLGAAIIAGLTTQWWFDLNNKDVSWLKCPVPLCGRSLPLNSSSQIAEVLELLGIQADYANVDTFERASELRTRLQTLHPLPGREEMRRSKMLHERLIRHRWMRPLLGSSSTRVDNTSPSEAQLLPVDTANGQSTLEVPIFTDLLYPRIPRTCVVCDETYQEFSPGDPDSWARSTRGFGGEWRWRVLSFPVSQILPNCSHDFTICRTCVARYISSQIDSQGHGVVGNIVCPTPGCAHLYSHGEVQSLAAPETFSAYDRYTVLNSISSLSNFRWCLREGCTAGGLYDDQDSSTTSATGIDANCIECSACHFTMCFDCQSPWHTNLTCAQHASQRDASFTETQTWLAQHTKPCPGDNCGVQVQKGDGCFHMTCSRCRFEFCWECLADWKDIFVPGEDGGFLRYDGHRDGCFFRSHEVPLPTQLLGHDVETGLRRLEEETVAPAPG